MRRVLAISLLALALLAPTAWCEEPPKAPAIDPAEVGRLLLSKDEDERARGTRLLQQRIQRGGDLKPFLAAMAKAQSEYADAEARLTKHFTDLALDGTPQEQERALRVLEALGEDAMRAYLERRAKARKPVPPSSPVRPGGEPPATNSPADGSTADGTPRLGTPEEPRPSRPADALRAKQAAEESPPADEARVGDRATLETEGTLVRLAWEVLEVPTIEVETWLEEEKDPHGTREALLPLRHGRAVVLGADGRFALTRAETLPEARSRLHVPEKTTPVGRDTELLPGAPVRYRCCVERAGKGAWGVKREELIRGLSVRARVAPRVEGARDGKAYELRLEVKHTDVPLPMRVEKVRPASNVEPLELDRPEWQTAVTQLRRAVALGDDVVAFVPGVVPDKVVVVGIRLARLVMPQAAARALEK